MASTYTANIGIEQPGSGEQAGAWGTTTNTNFDLIDRNLNGVGTIILSGTTHTLSTSDGTLSDGHFRVLVLSGSPSGTNTITISPNDQDKVYLVYNNSGQTAIFSQGSGANATIANGKTAWIYADGEGSGAAVRAVPADMVDDTTPQLGGNLDVNGNSIVSVSGGNIPITPDGSGKVIIDGLSHPTADGTANQVLTTDGAGNLSFANASASAFLSGMLMPYAGTSAPTGWVLCYGQSLNTYTYKDLHAVVSNTYGGTAYNAGVTDQNGATTVFSVPDLRGRTIAGQDDMGGASANRLTGQTGGLAGDTLGASGGVETHTLTEAQLPSHTHENTFGLASINSNYASGITGLVPTSPGGGNDTRATGSGSAHNNVQPTLILNYIIKT